MFDQNWRTSSFKLSVSYEKDKTIKPDSTEQRMMSLQDPMESVRTETKPRNKKTI